MIPTESEYFNTLIGLRALWKKIHRETDCGRSGLHGPECEHAYNELVQHGMIKTNGEDAEHLSPQERLLAAIFDGPEFIEDELAIINPIIRMADKIDYEIGNHEDLKSISHDNEVLKIFEAIKDLCENRPLYRIVLCLSGILRTIGEINGIPEPTDIFHISPVLGKLKRNALIKEVEQPDVQP